MNNQTKKILAEFQATYCNYISFIKIVIFGKDQGTCVKCHIKKNITPHKQTTHFP